MNKKILSLVIALVLVLGSVTTVFAGNFDLIHKLDSRKNTAMLELMEDLDVYDQVFEDFANYELEYESKKYALVDIQEKLDAGADGLQEAIEQIDKGEEPSGGLEVVEVSAINSTALKVEFNQKVDKTSAEKLTNYYVGIGDKDVSSSSIEANNTGLYKAELQEDGKTVIIKAVDEAANVIWLDKNTTTVLTTPAVALKVNATDFVVKNKMVTIQVRNVKDAAGNLMSTDAETFESVDEEAAKMYGTKVTYEADGTTIKAIAAADNNVTEVLVKTTKDVFFTFDEPVFVDTDVEFYLDGKNITTHVTQDLANDPSGKTIKVANAAGIEDLTLGNHKFQAVGVEDLAGNKTVGDIYNAVIKVVEPADDETEVEAPEVESIEQITEGKFEVTFKAAPVDGTLISIKDSKGNTVGTATPTTGGDATEEITFATDKADYKGSTKIIYTVEVTGADGGKIVSAADATVKADKYSKAHTFSLDLKAPEVVYSSVDADGKDVPTAFVGSDLMKIVVPFEDGLFGGPVALGTADGAIILKQHVGEETKSVTIPSTFTITTDGTGAVDFDAAAQTITIDFTKLKADADLGAAATAMLNKDEDALLAGEYELSLPRGLVEDTMALKVTDSTVIPFAGDKIEFEVEEVGQGGDEASVPQTAQDLVTYDEDHDAIIVEYVGVDIKASTAKNPANYTLAGKKLASSTYIEYETLKDGAGKVTGGVARIYLNKDTVALAGNYTLKVEGVTTSAGSAMYPVTVTVKGMQDNTRPVLESAVITGNAKLELKFSESVEVEDEDLAAGNFKVTVNGANYTVDKVEEDTKDSSLVILTLKDPAMEEGTSVVVITLVDDNNDYFVRDLSGNELKADVRVNATRLGE